MMDLRRWHVNPPDTQSAFTIALESGSQCVRETWKAGGADHSRCESAPGRACPTRHGRAHGSLRFPQQTAGLAKDNFVGDSVSSTAVTVHE